MRFIKRVSAVAVAVLCSVPAVASADTPKTHDGFYLQFAPGIGYVSDSATIKVPVASSDYKLSGVGGVGGLLLGGTPVPGLVIGGGIQGGRFSKPKFEQGGRSITGSGTLQISTIGPFVDYYLDPHSGLHFQGFIGLGIVSAETADGRSSQNNPTGFSISGAVGHDWFVSDSWSIGVMGRLQFVSAKYESGGASDNHSVLLPAVLATFTYH